MNEAEQSEIVKAFAFQINNALPGTGCMVILVNPRLHTDIMLAGNIGIDDYEKLFTRILQQMHGNRAKIQVVIKPNAQG